MKRCLAAIFFVILCSSGAWTQAVDVAAALGYPQVIIFNGKIVTMDDDSFGPQVGTIVQAMAIRDGKILLTGRNGEILPLAGPHTTKIDLKGREVLPGFIHSHEHPTDWAWTEPEPLKHVLPSGSNSSFIYRWLEGDAQQQIAEWKNVLKEEAAQAKPGQWVWLSTSYGPDFQYADALFEAFPKVFSRAELDQIAPNNPVRVRNDDPLTNVVNTKGLEEIKKVGAWSQGGAADSRRRGSDVGADLGRSVEPDVILKYDVDFLAKLLKAEFELWASQGITAFGSSTYASNNFRAISMLDQAGELPIRFGWAYTGDAWDDETLRYVAGLLGEGTPHLWNVGAWNAPGGTCKTYSASPEVKRKEVCSFAPGSRGAAHVEAIVRAGGRVATMHTGGDKDIDYYMDAIIRGAKEGHLTMDQIRAKRFAFDHSSGAPRPDQIPTMKKLGIIASMINTDLWEKRNPSYDIYYTVRAYGPEYANQVVPRKMLTDAHIPNGFEMDRWLPQKEFLMIWEGMTRYNPWDKKVYGPSQRTDRITQLKALTRWGAYYLLRENLMGSLEKGKFGDFIVLDRDFLTIPRDDIPNTKVVMTVVGGKIVHMMPDIAAENGMSPVGPVTWPSKPLENYYKHINYTSESLRNQY